MIKEGIIYVGTVHGLIQYFNSKIDTPFDDKIIYKDFTGKDSKLNAQIKKLYFDKKLGSIYLLSFTHSEKGQIANIKLELFFVHTIKEAETDNILKVDKYVLIKGTKQELLEWFKYNKNIEDKHIKTQLFSKGNSIREIKYDKLVDNELHSYSTYVLIEDNK